MLLGEQSCHGYKGEETSVGNAARVHIQELHG